MDLKLISNYGNSQTQLNIPLDTLISKAELCLSL